MEMLSLRDCDITDRIILKCLTGISNVRIVDLSGNPDINHVGWKGLADTLRLRREKRRMVHLIYQNSKYAIDEQVGEQFSLMFPSLQKLDLRRCQLTDEAVRKFLLAFSDKEPDHVSSIEKLDLTGGSFSQSALEDFDEINRRMAKNIIVFKAFDVQSENQTNSFCSCFRCCCCKRN
jgi:hypothetical protein